MLSVVKHSQALLRCVSARNIHCSAPACATPTGQRDVLPTSNTAAPAKMKLLRSERSGDLECCHIVTPDAAHTLVDAMQPHLAKGDTVMEMNPGPGLLTQALLESTSANVVAFEKRTVFYDQLEHQFQRQIKEKRLKLAFVDLKNFYSYHIFNKRGKLKVNNQFMGYFPSQVDPDRSNVKIVGVTASGRFLSRISTAMVLNASIFDKVLPTFYLYVPDRFLKIYLSNFPFINYSSFKHSVRFNYFFNCTKLTTVQSSDFYPRVKGTKSPGIHKVDNSLYHLMRIEPDFDFLREFDVEERRMFLYFLCLVTDKHNSSNLLLDTLDGWIPGFGVTLIDAGFRALTFTLELTKEQILLTYRLFRRHEDFDKSRFTDMKNEYLEQIQGMKTITVDTSDDPLKRKM